METYVKLCPGCKTTTALQAVRCHVCSHAYRTHFDPATVEVQWREAGPLPATSAAPATPRPPAAPPANGTASVEELLRWGLICTPEGTALRSLLDEQLEAVGRPAEVAVETAHLATVVPLVLAGAGAAMLPQGLASDAAAKGACVLPLAPPTRTSVHIVWRTGRLSEPAEHFLDFCLPDGASPMSDASPSDSRSV